jgi:MYXO-CTERM domain-containing protein
MELTPNPADPRRASLDLSWQGQSFVYLVVTGVSRGAPMRTVTISMGLPEDVPPIDGGGDGGCRVSAGRTDWSGGLLVMALGAILLWNRRRRAACCPH